MDDGMQQDSQTEGPSNLRADGDVRIDENPRPDEGVDDPKMAADAPNRRAAAGEEIASMFGVGSDRALAEIHHLAAKHHTFAALDVSTSDYMTIRDAEADDGRYRWRDDIAHERVDLKGLVEIRDQARCQLPRAVEALRHATEAVALEPDDEKSMFHLERALEVAVDAAGTLMVVTREIVTRGHEVNGR